MLVPVDGPEKLAVTTWLVPSSGIMQWFPGPQMSVSYEAPHESNVQPSSGVAFRSMPGPVPENAT